MSYFISKKDQSGKSHSFPITPPMHPAIKNSFLQKQESPSNKARHAKRIASVLLQKSKKFADNVNDKRKQIEEEKKQRIKQFDETIDEILDDNSLSPKQKFRRLQRFAHDNKKRLTQRQIHQINHELMELDLKHNITPEPVEQETKTHHDRNPNPVTFAHLQQEHDDVVSSVNNDTRQDEINKKADQLNEIEHRMQEPSSDEKAINENAKAFSKHREKSKLSEITQAEVDLENRK